MSAISKSFRSLKEVYGKANKQTAKVAIANLKNPNHNHCMLFVGPSGCGKTALARLIAHELGALDFDKAANYDYSEWNASDFRGIDSIRELRRLLPLSPTQGKARVWLLDECHMLTREAQEALLKCLDNCPPSAYILLATTEPKNLKITIQRRCSVYEMVPLDDEEMVQFLKDRYGEKIDADVCEEIAAESMGSPGVAISIADKIQNIPPKLQKSQVSGLASESDEFIKLAQTILRKSGTKNGWKEIASLIQDVQKNKSIRPESLRIKLLHYYSKVILSGGKEADFAFLIASTLYENYNWIGWPDLIIPLYYINKSKE